MKRRTLVAVLIGVPGLTLLAWLAINSVDEPLSAEAQALVEAGKPSNGPLDETNAYVWMTALGAPRRDEPLSFAQKQLQGVFEGKQGRAVLELAFDRSTACHPEQSQCFGIDGPTATKLQSAIEGSDSKVQLVRRMHEAAVFVEIAGPSRVQVVISDMRGVSYAQDVAFAEARLAAAAQDWGVAVGALEADMAFNRKALAGSTTLISKLIAGRAIARNALMAAQLWQTHGNRLSIYLDRLAALVVPLPSADIALGRAAAYDGASAVAVMANHGHASLLILAGGKRGGLRGYVEELFYLPNATANAIASGVVQQQAALTGDTAGFDAARSAVGRPRAPAADRSWYEHLALRNMTGLVLVDASASMDYTVFQAGLHDVQALLTLVRARLAAPPNATEAEWTAVLAMSKWTDPYTGEPLRVDPALGQPAIVARRTDAKWPKAMLEATNGRLVAQISFDRH